MLAPNAIRQDSRLLPQLSWRLAAAKGSGALSFDLGRFVAINLRDSGPTINGMTASQGGPRAM